MKRNDVVCLKGGASTLYGRIVRRVGDDSFLWICCGLHIHIDRQEDLEVVDYKGRPEFSTDGVIEYFHRGRDGWPDFSRKKFSRPTFFIPMPTLRELKQSASRYHGRNVWKTPEDYDFIQRYRPAED